MNYKQLGFKCGIEIHNRLNTKHKLFCDCKPQFSNQKPTQIIKRKLRAVAGELGQIDIAAAYEYLRDRIFHYQIFKDTTCLVELDEEPPHELNREALQIALQIAKLLKAEIPNEIHVMRKTVIDGSNTAGFQRTAIIGTNGILKTFQGDVRIALISLEEEAAGIVNNKGNEITYRLDRLGIPLVEIGTETDIKNPEHAKEVAEKLGMIVRSTGKSQRGIGVTRQDVNVSIKGGARVEMKGVQELAMIPQIIENEIKRQQELIKKGKKPKEETRVAKPDGSTEFTRPLPGGERMYPETDIEPIVIKGNLLKIKVPETWEQKIIKFKKILPKEMADQILKSEYLDLFEKFKDYGPTMVANTFTSVIKDLRRQGKEIDLNEKDFEKIFKAVKSKKISKEAIPKILISKSIDEELKKEKISESELKNIIKNIFKEYPDLVKEKRESALMGEVMKKVRGKVDGQTVSKLLKEEL
ncbi:MAG: Glu-tRNA(Gln) amidotransferase subunit GatE [Candidatus Hodarchaeales archaeon]|jgi:Glu-tRNA(Gln) amidotransferase subunit E-like FAD-binding protein